MSKTSKIVIGIIVVVLIVVVATSKRTSSEPIKIGFVGPLTGDASALGKEAQIATQLAIDEVNASGGINGRKVVGIFEDGKCSPASASSAGQKLIGVDKVTAIVGGLCSGETASFVKPAMEAKVPVIAYCSSAPTLTGSGKYFFRTYPSDSFQGKFAAEYAYNTIGARKVAVLYHVTDWGNGIEKVFVNRFKELGGTIVSEEGAQQDVRDYRTQLVKVKNAGADLLYTPLYPEGGAVVVQQALTLGLKAKILGTETYDDAHFLSAVPKNAELVYTISATASNADFTKKMQGKTGNATVQACAPQAYDAANAIFAGLKAGGLDIDKVADTIRANSFDGVSGHIQFDSNGDLASAIYDVKKIVNNTASVVK